MKIVFILVFTIMAINMAWLVIFGIRDYLKRSEQGETYTYLRIAVRNIAGIMINIGLVIVLRICRAFHLPW